MDGPLYRSPFDGRTAGSANVAYVVAVADDELECEDLVLDVTVLRYIQIDTKILIETNRAVLDRVGCSIMSNLTINESLGHVSPTMVVRLHRFVDNLRYCDFCKPTSRQLQLRIQRQGTFCRMRGFMFLLQLEHQLPRALAAEEFLTCTE